MPAKRIIILEKMEGNRFRYALWADVPVGRRSYYSSPDKKSAWQGASAAENADISSGAVVEEVNVTALPPGATLAQIQAALQAEWQAFQDRINASNPWNRYGSYWDGTSWTLAGVS